ncbi:DUF3152 domain-containing protein, partial [Bifidobacterium pullorum]|uniref:DUF3152 domain-containing protein n=1 Tax=Bifidobacterium pullorum TaxID=78448 RepID=UPI00242F6A94
MVASRNSDGHGDDRRADAPRPTGARPSGAGPGADSNAGANPDANANPNANSTPNPDAGRQAIAAAKRLMASIAAASRSAARSFSRFVSHTVAPACRSAVQAAANMFHTVFHGLSTVWTRFVSDMRPSEAEPRPSGKPRTSAEGRASAKATPRAGAAASAAQSESASRSASPARGVSSKNAAPSRDMAHVYLVRRIVVFGGAALVLLAVILGVVFGVRALTAGPDAGDGPQSISRSAASDAAETPDSDTSADSDAEADSSDSFADGKSDNKDSKADQDADPADSSATPLSDDRRAAILAEAQQTAADSGNPLAEFTYCVASKGEVGDLTDFANTVFTTLNDSRGWPRAGATFQESDDADSCDMTLILAAADQMTSFSADCSSEYSCRVGNDVVINIDRWNNATEDWLDAGGTIPRYRTMVINHEVGHRLGHYDNEMTCP